MSVRHFFPVQVFCYINPSEYHVTSSKYHRFHLIIFVVEICQKIFGHAELTVPLYTPQMFWVGYFFNLISCISITNSGV